MAWKGVLIEGVVGAAETQWGDEGGQRAMVEGVSDGVLLLHGQEQDMRNHFGH
jgi:hypothetical protein